MTPDQKHLAGAILMWLGVSLGVVLVFGILPRHPMEGLVGFGAALSMAAVGMWMKKKYCPRCRANGCTLPDSEKSRGSGERERITPPHSSDPGA